MKNIVVVGSINMDLVMGVENIPKIGETIHGNYVDYFVGGKGANQAVAASRVNASVKFIGAVGNDEFGVTLKETLKNENIDISAVENCNLASGMATIFKTKEDNAILVIPGANSKCDVEQVDKYASFIEEAQVLITQFEIPKNTIKRALELAKKNGVKTIVNPAPASKIDEDMLKNIDFITPNETEFEVISGKKFANEEELELEMIKWQEENTTILIVTRGAYGVSIVKNRKIETVKSIKVDVVDTTGAGDTFNGTFATQIADNMNLFDAIKFANRAATLSVTKLGAQTGMPRLEEVKKIL